MPTQVSVRSLWAGVVLVCLVFVSRAPAAQAPAAKEEEPPAPIDLKGNELTTKDGVLLRATYFPSPLTADRDNKDAAKAAVPVILLHGHKGNRTEYAGLAFYLQRLGHAVLVPDLRGHGESNQYVKGPGETGQLDAAKLVPNDFRAMISYDMPVLCKYLRKRNNDGELNYDKLCIVGAGPMGSAVALAYAFDDWKWPPYRNERQGQFVRALVLISPELNFKGINANNSLALPGVRSMISVQILYGNGDTKAAAEAQRLYSVFEKAHPKPPEDEKEALGKQDLFLKGLDAKLQGTKLLGIRALGVEQKIAAFIKLRLVDQEIPWSAHYTAQELQQQK